ncbi:hypothetical protein SD71_05945 [Cohnella kolymensis]|uniref:UPF0342 protein SD71_05945 n=1 Tax=Cohnella kolymensis TaxID=1590652 RepID=A0ABR5A6S5_9BACL|nr:YlbF family regulator [Cohnella kolymensis]KIL36781.1 hypothetical protein SD71_05945 [Cohnella kolymensis]
MNVYDTAYELAKALKAGPEAAEWKAANSAVSRDADAKRMLDDFRERQMGFQQAMMEGKEPSSEDMDRMNKLYEVINLNPAVRRVMDAERRLSLQFEDVNRILSEALRDIVGDPK